MASNLIRELVGEHTHLYRDDPEFYNFVHTFASAAVVVIDTAAKNAKEAAALREISTGRRMLSHDEFMRDYHGHRND